MGCRGQIKAFHIYQGASPVILQGCYTKAEFHQRPGLCFGLHRSYFAWNDLSLTSSPPGARHQECRYRAESLQPCRISSYYLGKGRAENKGKERSNISDYQKMYMDSKETVLHLFLKKMRKRTKSSLLQRKNRRLMRNGDGRNRGEHICSNFSETSSLSAQCAC